MKQLLILVFLFSACQTTTTQRENKNNVENKSENQSKENFDEFFKKYKTDSVFQLQRTLFPVRFWAEADEINEGFDTLLTPEKWIRLDFQDRIDQKYDNFTFEKEVKDDNTIYIIQKGIDNGIYTEYRFVIEDKKWFLKEIYDTST